MLCHETPDLVAQISNRLTLGTDNYIVIHVDKKTDIEPFKLLLLNNTHVVFMNERFEIYWGGVNSVKATISAMKIGMELHGERFVLLQGKDYPLRNNLEIDSFFEKYRNVNFIKACNITKAKRKYSYMKCYGFHLYNNVDRTTFNFRRCLSKILNIINKLGIKYRKGYYYNSRTNTRYDIYWGAAQFSLTKDCVNYILRVVEKDERLLDFFKYRFPVDELFFQTIVYNSHFSYTTKDGAPIIEKENMRLVDMKNLTYFEYPNSIRKFNSISEVPPDVISNYLFIGKVSPAFISSIK